MTEIIAEIGSNYITKDGPSIGRAVELIEKAKDAGCDGVKFQYFKADKLWDKAKFPNEHKAAAGRELPFNWISVLSDHAYNHGLIFGCSVFDPEDINSVKDVVDFLKISSYEATWKELVETCYATGKRLMVSLGQVKTEDEYYDIVKWTESKADLLWCVSDYPAKDVNLGPISLYTDINGYSDHSMSEQTVINAITMGAKVIELHFDLDDKKGVETAHSWKPVYVRKMIEYVKEIKVTEGEKNIEKANKNVDIKYRHNNETGKRG
jgi:sialic acid synthase SpsE